MNFIFLEQKKAAKNQTISQNKLVEKNEMNRKKRVNGNLLFYERLFYQIQSEHVQVYISHSNFSKYPVTQKYLISFTIRWKNQRKR